MAITTLDGYLAAAKQRLQWIKTTSRTSVATIPFSVFDIAGNPGAGTLAGTSTTAGVVPTDATAGCPIITAFGGVGYLSKVEFASTIACWVDVYDMLWKGGAYAFNANTAVTAPPSYSGRVPSADYTGLQIWAEQVTAGTGLQSVNVTYTNQAGTGGKTTGATSAGAAAIVGRCWQLPLASGDAGVQLIQNVTGTVASVGTFNVLVLRPLWSGRVTIANGGDVHDLIKTGLPVLYDTSALIALIAPDSTATGIPELMIEIANG